MIFLGPLISMAISAISAVATTIGAGLSTMATTLLKVAGPALEAVGKIAFDVGVQLLVNSMSPRELGARAQLSDKKPEDFDSINDYINHLKNDIELDKAKFENMNDTEKLASDAIGLGIIMKGIEEKKGFEIPMNVWVDLAKLDIQNPKEVNAILDTFKSGLDMFVGYVENRLDENKEIEVGNKLVDMYQKLDPNISKNEIEQKVISMEINK